MPRKDSMVMVDIVPMASMARTTPIASWVSIVLRALNAPTVPQWIGGISIAYAASDTSSTALV